MKKSSTINWIGVVAVSLSIIVFLFNLNDKISDNRNDITEVRTDVKWIVSEIKDAKKNDNTTRIIESDNKYWDCKPFNNVLSLFVKPIRN